MHEQLEHNVRQLCGMENGFAALKVDGSVVIWGSTTLYGDPDASSRVHWLLRGGVQKIYSNYYIFAAVKVDGTVVCWDSRPSPFPAGSELALILYVPMTEASFLLFIVLRVLL